MNDTQGSISALSEARTRLLPPVLVEVAAERQRQVEKGYTAEHDDAQELGALAAAGSCYASYALAVGQSPDVPPARWPWDASAWKPKTNREDWIRAAALILAEVERWDRQRQRRPRPPSGGEDTTSSSPSEGDEVSQDAFSSPHSTDGDDELPRCHGKPLIPDPVFKGQLKCQHCDFRLLVQYQQPALTLIETARLRQLECEVEGLREELGSLRSQPGVRLLRPYDAVPVQVNEPTTGRSYTGLVAAPANDPPRPSGAYLPDGSRVRAIDPATGDES